VSLSSHHINYGHHFSSCQITSLTIFTPWIGTLSHTIRSLALSKSCSDDNMLPADVCEQIEDNIIPALEYLEGWEPSDADIQAHIDSRGMF
jgi:hypothetical protein